MIYIKRAFHIEMLFYYFKEILFIHFSEVKYDWTYVDE